MSAGVAVPGEPDDEKSFIEQFNDFMEENCFPKSWEPEKRERAKDIVKKSNTKTALYASIPMRCRGDKCPFASVCPLNKEKIAPIGSRCPIEMKRVGDIMQGYMESLGIEEANTIEASLVRDLTDIEIQYLRKATYLSEEDFIQDVVIGVDQNGRPIMSKQINLAVEIDEKLHKRKANLLKMFAATREMRIKAGESMKDSAQAMASMVDQFAKLQYMKDKLTLEKASLPVEEITDDDLD